MPGIASWNSLEMTILANILANMPSNPMFMSYTLHRHIYQRGGMAKKPDITIGEITWKYLGSGSFNDAYHATIEGLGHLVYKIPKASSTSNPGEYSPALKAMDTPLRAVRLWDKVNPDFPANIYEKGWTAPFIEGTQPDPKEICDAIVDLYGRTGRVLADAMVRGNLKKTRTGEIICVDVGAALKLEEELEVEKSEASLDFWREMKEAYNRNFKKNSNNLVYVSIYNMTKALLVLQQFRPDVLQVSSLKTDSQLVKNLKETYDTNKLPSDIYTTFPINLEYFSKITLFKDIVSAKSFSDDQKRHLCQLYQCKKFGETHKKLLSLLIDDFHVNASDAINIIQKNNIEQAGTLIRNLSDNKQIFQAISSYFKQTPNSEQSYLVAVLEKPNILTKDSFEILNALNKGNILTEANFSQVESHTDLRSLAVAVSALSQNKLLTQEHFSLVKSHTDLRSLARAVSALSRNKLLTQENFSQVILDANLILKINTLYQKGRLTKDSFEILNALNKGNILTQENFSQLGSHTDLRSLAGVVSALSQNKLLTKENFNQLQSHTDLRSLARALSALSENKPLTKDSFDLEAFNTQGMFYIELIKSGIEKIDVKNNLNNAIFMVNNAEVNAKEKIRMLCEIGKNIMESCLKNESGILGMGFFSKTGKTQSYQDAMGHVKKELLKILGDTDPGCINKENIERAKSILGEHVRRGSHIMDARSLSDPAFQSHEAFYKKNVSIKTRPQ